MNCEWRNDTGRCEQEGTFHWLEDIGPFEFCAAHWRLVLANLAHASRDGAMGLLHLNRAHRASLVASPEEHRDAAINVTAIGSSIRRGIATYARIASV